MESLPTDLLLQVSVQLDARDVLSLSSVNRTIHTALVDMPLPAGHWAVRRMLPLRTGGDLLLRMVPPADRARVRQCFPDLPPYDGPVEENSRFAHVKHAFTLKANDLPDLGGLLLDVDVPVAIMTITTTEMFDRMFARVFRYVVLRGANIRFATMHTCPRLVDFVRTDLTTVPAHFWDTYAGTTIFFFHDTRMECGVEVQGILCYKDGDVIAGKRIHWNAATSIDHAFARAHTLHISSSSPPPITLLCTTLALTWTQWRGHGVEQRSAEQRQVPNLRSLVLCYADIKVHGFLHLERLTIAGHCVTSPVHSNPRLHRLILDRGSMPRTGPGNTALQEILLSPSATHSDRVPCRHVEVATEEYAIDYHCALRMHRDAIHQLGCD